MRFGATRLRLCDFCLDFDVFSFAGCNRSHSARHILTSKYCHRREGALVLIGRRRSGVGVTLSRMQESDGASLDQTKNGRPNEA